MPVGAVMFLDRSQWFSLMLVAALVFPVGSVALAQSDGNMALLGIPSGATLRCHVLAVTADEAAQGADFHLHVELVRPLGSGTRTDEILFDSTGKALSLIETLTTTNGDGSANLDAVTALFAPTGQVLGTHSHYEGASPEAKEPVRARATATLSNRQAAEVSALAKWFWDHRCGRARTGSKAEAHVLNFGRGWDAPSALDPI
jgi:hypothetical protein